MKYLIKTSFIWALSFGFIGHYLAGKVDSYVAVSIRFFLGFVTLFPFLNLKNQKLKLSLKLMAIGSIQVGLMYIFFFKSFLYLAPHEVALFTIFTPLYIYLLSSIINQRFRWSVLFFVLLSVVGASLIKWSKIESEFLIGFLMVQAANLSFSVGQLSYKELFKANQNFNDLSHFAWFYLGALCISLPSMILWGDFNKLPETPTQFLTLAWLGTIASGLGYYWWNKGSRMVSGSRLAALNNLVIPLSILFESLIWRSQNIDFIYIFGSLMIILSIFLISHQEHKHQY